MLKSLKSLVLLGFVASTSFAGYWPCPIDYCGQKLTAEDEEKIGMWLLPSIDPRAGMFSSICSTLSHTSFSMSSVPVTKQQHYRVVQYEGSIQDQKVLLYFIRSSPTLTKDNPISRQTITRENEKTKRWVKMVVSNKLKHAGSKVQWGKNVGFTPLISEQGVAFWEINVDFITQNEQQAEVALPLKFIVNLCETEGEPSESITLRKDFEENFKKVFFGGSVSSTSIFDSPPKTELPPPQAEGSVDVSEVEDPPAPSTVLCPVVSTDQITGKKLLVLKRMSTAMELSEIHFPD